MNTPQYSAEARVLPLETQDPVTREWCHMHRLIEELSSVQIRLGTPLEQPDDFVRVRGLGSNISEKLGELSPWVASAPVRTHRQVWT